MPGSLWLPARPGHSAVGAGCCTESLGHSTGHSCTLCCDLPLQCTLEHNSSFLFPEFSLSFHLGELQSALEVCFISQSESVFLNLIKQRAVLAVKYEPDSQPSCALGSISIDCSRLGSILISVKILK